jgi:enoyl-CoA hydratase
MELALTGNPITAERAAELGLVNRLAEPGEAVVEATRLAEEIAVNAPLALIASKRILQEQWDWSAAEMWDTQSAISDPVFTSEDAREGATAFAEKRPPVWQGK